MELQSRLDQIESNKQQIEAAGKFSVDILNKIQYKFRLDWNYYSNKMEGGTLTRQETRSVMVGNVTVGGKPIKDVMEMKGHDNIVSDILKIGKGELRLSEKRIKDIHRAIMHEDDPEHAKLIGKWKEAPNEVINYKGEKLPFTIPEEVPDKIHHLLNTTNTRLDNFFTGGKDRLHPLLIAADFHLEYVTIHPFYDGNGRTTRILSNLILISCGYPPIIIKENEKESYYQYLADIQAYGGGKDLFYNFMASKLADSQQLILDAIQGKDIEETDDIKKEIELLKKELANRDFSKSPKNVFDVYRSTEHEVWLKLLETLKTFEEFFSESKTRRHLNYKEEDFGKRTVNLLAPAFTKEVSNKPEELKIFGYDIYDEDVKQIEWKHRKLGLKGATKNTACQVILKMEFHKTDYTLILEVNSTSVYSKTYRYLNYAGPTDVEELKTVLAKALLKSIKENTK